MSKELTILNTACVVGASVAITVACKATKSAVPLLAYLIIPKWVTVPKPNCTNVTNIANEKED